MNAEALVLMLEEHLADIHAHLVREAWQSFVAALKETARGLTPNRDDLNSWSDRMAVLLMKFQYTKGLLQGFRFFATLQQRGGPARIPCPAPTKAPVRPATDAELVDRIRGIVTRASSLV